jgi:fatty-acyl-CoA synthase
MSEPPRAGEATKSWLRALERTAGLAHDPARILPSVIDELAARHGDAPALVSVGETLSHRALAARMHSYARRALAHGLAPGEVVALLMPNCSEYLAIWLGLTRVGVTVALINAQLTGDALAHALRVALPRLVVVDASLAPPLAAALATLTVRPEVWVRGEPFPEFTPLPDEPASDTHAPAAVRAALADRALLIYTSGTTGLPKAANLSHLRLMQWSHWFFGMMDTRPDDRMYNCLPLYHSVGGVVATFATLLGGGAVVIREKFSARQFWSDVSESNCTLFQYIGELCRYLADSPPDAAETRHRLRLCCGNGLRADVWEPFRARFRIPRILEYYAATEGSFSLYNCEQQPGSIGRIPPFLPQRKMVEIVRFDADRLEPRRGADGRCERCANEEVGEAIGQIAGSEPIGPGRFEGYSDPAASEAKILRDVFVAGDAWYRTGDLMRRDGRGFFYFADRIGDTYRWKGENVAAAEVCGALLACAGVREAVVYGVAIPATDGRAGMAAMVVAPDFDLRRFEAELRPLLPAYALPVFLRLLPAMMVTETYKPRTRALMLEGFNPATVRDPLYVRDGATRSYRPLDGAVHAQLARGELRL